MERRTKELFTLYDTQRTIGLTAFTTMLKPVNSTCNPDCNYCYYLDNAIQYSGRQAVVLFRLSSALKLCGFLHFGCDPLCAEVAEASE